VEIDLGAIAAYLKGKRVLVTGAGRSIAVGALPPDLGFLPELMVL